MRLWKETGRIKHFIVRRGGWVRDLHVVEGRKEIALDKVKKILCAFDPKGACMAVAEELLKPISEDAPCGIDLSYDARLQELETLARGKPETQFSAAEPPDWKQIRARCLELFGQSKDLRVALTLTVALLELEGLAGFREGLSLINGLLKNYWTTVHPQLDPADDNDPLQRMNIVASLATSIGTFGDPFQILEKLRRTPLSNSTRMGRYSLGDILKVEAGATDGGEAPSLTVSQIDAAFRDTKPQELGETYRCVTDCLGTVKEMDETIMATVGASNAPDLDLLIRELAAMQKRIGPHIASATVTAEVEQGVASSDFSAQSGQGAFSISGEIRNRQEVAILLEKICAYYDRVEPSSPVPLLLKRAARLAEMGFMQIIEDLSPDAIAQIRTVTGEKEE
jgi:type VI secretion system protein ImpA